MMSRSAWALRGRPGALRSWSAGSSTLTVVMRSIVTELSRLGHMPLASCLDQLDALLLGQTLGTGRGRGGRRALAGQPDRRDQRAEQREDRAADRRVVHRRDEGVVG